MKCSEVIEVFRAQAPEAYACDWDNVGLLVGSREKEVRCIYVALDATDETIQEAVEAGADLLLTHHPMIFKGLKKVSEQDFIGRRVIALIQNDMAYYAMHTNFDILGMADLAAERLGLVNRAVLQPSGKPGSVMPRLSKKTGAPDEKVPQPFGKTDAGTEELAVGKTDAGTEVLAVGIGKVGELPGRMSLEECIKTVKKAFSVDLVKVFAPSGPGEPLQIPVLRAAICPGSGKSVIEDALRAGAQVLITGDIDHHEGIDAAARGMAVIDAGHYGLEKMFIPYMTEYLKDRLPELAVIGQQPKQPFLYF